MIISGIKIIDKIFQQNQIYKKKNFIIKIKDIRINYKSLAYITYIKRSLA